MNLPFVVGSVTVLVIVVLGWPTARLTSRHASAAGATAPATAGLAVAVAVGLCILTGTSLVPWLLLIALAGWAVYLDARRRGRLVTADDGPGNLALVVAIAVALLPVLLVDVPAVESDARYIWWFHAGWFRHGGDVTRSGMTEPLFQFSRSRYPPVLPGVIAVVWHVVDAYGSETALRVSQLFTVAAVAAAGFHTAAAARLRGRGAAVLAAVVVGVGWGANAQVGLVGFADLAWSSLFVAGAVLLLAGTVERRTEWTGAMFAATAALVKFEGQVAAAALLVLVVARAGRDWRRAVPALMVVGTAVVGWQVVVGVVGAVPDERGDWGQLVHLLDSDREVHRRLLTTVGHLAGELGPLVALAAATIVTVLLLARWGGIRLRAPGALTLLAVASLYLVVVALVFAVAPEDLGPYLDVAAYRTVIVVRLVVLADLTLVGVAAARALGLLSEPPVSPERPEPPESTGPTEPPESTAGAEPVAGRAPSATGAGGRGRAWVQRRPRGGGPAGVRPAAAVAVLAAVVLARAGYYAARGAGLVLDDWSIAASGGIARLWDHPNTSFALSRPGAWLLLTTVNGSIGPHPLVLLAVLSALQLTAAWLLYRVVAGWTDDRWALAVAATWLLMANHTALTVWAPTLPALVALCLLLGGALLWGRGRWALATAGLVVAGLCYEATLPAAIAAAVVLPAAPAIERRRRTVTVALLAAVVAWVATHPLYDTALHTPPLGAFWDAHFGAGLSGAPSGALTAALRVAAGVVVVAAAVRYAQGDRARGGGPWLVGAGLVVGALGALGWVTLHGLDTPLGVLDRILVVSSIGAALVVVGALRLVGDRAPAAAAGLAVALVVVLAVGQTRVLGDWSEAGADVVALLDHVAGLSDHPGAQDYVVGPSPAVLDHGRVFGVYTEGFADDAAEVAFGDDRGSITIASGPATFTSEGRGTLVDWSDVLGGAPVTYQNLVAGAPTGYLEAADLVGPGRLAVGGWAVDRSDPAGPVGITLRVDGEELDLGDAALARPDVAAAFPGAGEGHGFAAEVAVGPGPHVVCAVARDAGEGSDAPLLAGDAPGRVGAYCLSVDPGAAS